MMMRKEDDWVVLSRHETPTKATPHLARLRMMAELRFVGDPALVCDMLPAVLALDPAANSFLVGRQGQKGRESVCALLYANS